jgi:hypothetical protein
MFYWNMHKCYAEAYYFKFASAVAYVWRKFYLEKLH